MVYECYEDTYGYDIYGFPEITGIIEDTPVLNAVDKFYINDTWMEFDGSVRIKPVLTAGHTNGTDSFIFELTDPATNETLTISYLGGYGVNGQHQVTTPTTTRRTGVICACPSSTACATCSKLWSRTT